MSIHEAIRSAAIVGLACLGALAMPVPATDTTFATQADRILDRYTDPTGAEASVAVVRDHRVIYESARGKASIELHVAANVENVYRIGSITKTVTAATVLLLVHQGKLSTSDSLAAFLPDYPGASGITIDQLLSHTAGVSDEWSADGSQRMDTKAMVDAIGKQPLDFPPGTAWRYSNSGYMLLGAVIEKVTGQPWYEAERDLVLVPFAMKHTGYFDDDAVVADAAQGYSVDAAGRTTRPAFVSITGPMSAGALASTAGDMARLAEGLNDPHRFPPSLLVAMTTPSKPADGTNVPYGKGLMLSSLRGEPAFGHTGGIEGFSSQLIYVPGKHVAVAMLTNSDAGRPNARSLALQLAALAAGNPYRNFVDTTLTDEEKKALVGRYAIDTDAVHNITLEGGELYIQRSTGPKRRLVSAKGGLLYYAGDGTDYFQVVKGSDGSVAAIEFHGDGMPSARTERREVLHR